MSKMSEARFSAGEGDSYISAKAQYEIGKFTIERGLDKLNFNMSQLPDLVDILIAMQNHKPVSEMNDAEFKAYVKGEIV